MRWRLAMTVAAMTMTVSSTATVHAYCVKQVDGASDVSHWEGTVTYHVSGTLTDEDKLAAIDAAFATWEAVDCSTLAFTKGDDFAIDEIPFQDHKQKGIYIFWYEDATDWPDDPKYASTSYYGTDVKGAITQASIAINGFSTTMPWATDGSASALDLQAEMTSFIGQVIGIDYSDVADSIMTDTMSFGDVDKRELKDDDIAALQHLYLEDGCPEPEPPGDCSTTSPDGGPADGGPTDGAPTDSASSSDGTASDGASGDSAAFLDGAVMPDRCTGSNDCPDGMVCTAEGICVTQGSDDDGCCSVDQRRPSLFTLLLVVALGLCLLRRRHTS